MEMIFNPGLREFSDIPPKREKVIISSSKTKTRLKTKSQNVLLPRSNSVQRHICKYFTNTFFQFFLIPQMIASCKTAEVTFQTNLDATMRSRRPAVSNSNPAAFSTSQRWTLGGWSGAVESKQIVFSPSPVVHYMCLTKACESNTQV